MRIGERLRRAIGQPSLEDDQRAVLRYAQARVSITHSGVCAAMGFDQLQAVLIMGHLHAAGLLAPAYGKWRASNIGFRAVEKVL